MADANPSRIGQTDGAGDVDSLFLKVFGSMVLASFAQKTVMMGRNFVRTIASGKSAQFPVIGRADARYHTPGTLIEGQNILHNEKTITIDDQLIADVFVANIDEAKNHYDVRKFYAQELGIALANQMDKHILQQFIIGANDATAAVSGETDRVGTIIDRTDAGLADTTNDSFLGQANAQNMVKAIVKAATVLDEKNVPEEGRFCVLKPTEYNALSQLDNIVGADFARANAGAKESGRISHIAGIQILKSNNLPTTNVTASPQAGDANARHTVNATSTAAVIGHPYGVGTLKLRDMSTEMEYQMNRQGTLMLSKYLVGHDVLRPECCVLVKDVEGS